MKFDFKKNLTYIIILMVGIGGLCFGGYEIYNSEKPKTGSAQTSDSGANPSAPNGSDQRGQWGQGGGRGNFARLHGTVTSVSDSTIVMKADDGSSKNISVSSDTRISRMDNGQRTTLAISDVKANDEISVMASDNSQSTITPRMIIIGAFAPSQRGQYQGGGNNGYNSSGGTDSTSSNSSI